MRSQACWSEMRLLGPKTVDEIGTGYTEVRRQKQRINTDKPQKKTACTKIYPHPAKRTWLSCSAATGDSAELFARSSGRQIASRVA